MWYWVKLPDGDKADYNLEELKLALAEGKVQPDWPACRYNEQQFHPVQTLLEQDNEEQAEVAKPPAKYVLLTCGKCHQPLRLELPIEELSYPCPACDTKYKATKASESPLVYVLMPEVSGS